VYREVQVTTIQELGAFNNFLVHLLYKMTEMVCLFVHGIKVEITHGVLYLTQPLLGLVL
jgi:hypothetical protein